MGHQRRVKGEQHRIVGLVLEVSRQRLDGTSAVVKVTAGPQGPDTEQKRVAVVQQYPGPAGIDAANGPQDARNAQLAVLQAGLNRQAHLGESRLLPQRLLWAAVNQHDGSLHGSGPC